MAAQAKVLQLSSYFQDVSSGLRKLLFGEALDEYEKEKFGIIASVIKEIDFIFLQERLKREGSVDTEICQLGSVGTPVYFKEIEYEFGLGRFSTAPGNYGGHSRFVKSLYATLEAQGRAAPLFREDLERAVRFTHDLSGNYLSSLQSPHGCCLAA